MQTPANIEPSLSPEDRAILRAQWQVELFQPIPSRLAVLKLRPTWDLTPIRIRVHRNHSFELLAAACAPWFAFWNRSVEWNIGEYDDSLFFDFDKSKSADAEIVWLDAKNYDERLKGELFESWLSERLADLRQQTDAVILVIIVGAKNEVISRLEKRTQGLPGVRIGNVSNLAEQLGSHFWDERAAAFSGTRLSDKASLLCARQIASQWAPSMLMPRIKAVVVDLDNTLYEGVLGEDGSDVLLTEAHAAFQRYLLQLRQKGLFLALASRNEEEDVRQLFAARTDFPLQWDSFSVAVVSWNSKVEAIQKIANTLRIHTDSVVFVDDNPGELAAVAGQLPEVKTLHASPDAALTLRSLELMPGIFSWEQTDTDILRVADLEIEQERSLLASKISDPMAYLKSLDIHMILETCPKKHARRIYELSQKTNQFNLSISRLSEIEVARILEAPEERIVTISVSDRLSDSGLIAILCAKRENKTLIIHELAISCRALGRQLESIMIVEAIRTILAELPAEHVKFQYKTGPRNGPARAWLANFTGQSLLEEGTVDCGASLQSFDTSKFPLKINIQTT